MKPPFRSTPNYSVQAPVPLAGHTRQIRATLNGTRQIAGSVDIRATAPGKGASQLRGHQVSVHSSHYADCTHRLDPGALSGEQLGRIQRARSVHKAIGEVARAGQVLFCSSRAAKVLLRGAPRRRCSGKSGGMLSSHQRCLLYDRFHGLYSERAVFDREGPQLVPIQGSTDWLDQLFQADVPDEPAHLHHILEIPDRLQRHHAGSGGAILRSFLRSRTSPMPVFQPNRKSAPGQSF